MPATTKASEKGRIAYRAGKMKRRDIIQRLEAAGLTLVEGSNHTKVYRDGIVVSLVARHREIPENTVRLIEKQTGVTLR